MQLHLVVAKDKFDALPKPYQAALRAAAAIANASVLAKYDAANPGALKRLVVGGAQLRLFPQDALEACYKTANDLYAQLGADDPKFKKIADSYMAFRADQYLWWQVAEYSFDNFMIRERRSRSSRVAAVARVTPRRCPRSRPATFRPAPWSAAPATGSSPRRC